MKISIVHNQSAQMWLLSTGSKTWKISEPKDTIAICKFSVINDWFQWYQGLYK